jgi:tetratricopeptide (TPR) repeat protein
VGKTALALHWAHRAQGRFTDGTLFAELRGYAPKARPRAAGEVLDGFLRALGTQDIPAGEEERAAAFRTALSGKSVLIVLDNAASASQVRPLLPGSASCLALVTSRGELSGLAIRNGAARVPLTPLSEPDAVALLRRIVARHRVDAEPGAAAEVARLCAGLPLALRIAAERAAVRSSLQLADLASQLSAERSRLDLLASADDESVAVRSAFAWSYRALPGEAARMFRLLSLHPGADVSEAAAAALAALAVARTRRLLDYLTGVNLLEEGAPGRFRLHDLLRLYAAERARSEETEQDRALAVGRLIHWYLRSADAADRVLMPHRPRPQLGPCPEFCEPVVFTSHDQAMAWCDTEVANLAVVTRLAASAGEHAAAWQLPAALWSSFYSRDALDPWIATSEIGLASARRTADRPAEAWMLSNLASAYLARNQPDRALRFAEQALAIRREQDDVAGVARSLGMATDALIKLGRFDEAAELITEAIGIVRGIGDVFLTGVALDTLGRIHQNAARSSEAIDCFRQAIDIFGTLEERLYVGDPAHNLASVYRSIGEQREAIGWYERALEIRRDGGDLAGQAQTLLDLGDLHHDRGHAHAAHDAWREALDIYRRVGDQRRAAEARTRLGPGR